MGIVGCISYFVLFYTTITHDFICTNKTNDEVKNFTDTGIYKDARMRSFTIKENV